MAFPNPLIEPDLRDAMIDLFTDECFRLEKELMPTTPISDYAKELILIESVKRADDAVFVKYGFRIRDIFIKEPNQE